MQASRPAYLLVSLIQALCCRFSLAAVTAGALGAPTLVSFTSPTPASRHAYLLV